MTDERRRLDALRRYQVLDTLPESALDDLTRLAAELCGTPIALVSLVDAQRVWFKARVGLEASELPRDDAFCPHALKRRGIFVVRDAAADERFARTPAVTGAPGIRFYAGAPLVTPEGAPIGTLCVIDRIPRTLTPKQEEMLGVLARQVMLQLELRVHTQALVASETRSRAIVDSALDAIIDIDDVNHITEFNPAAERIFGWRRDEALGRDMADLLIPERLREGHRRGLQRYLATGESTVLDRRLELSAIRRDGTEFPIELSATKLSAAPPRFAAFIRDITARTQAEAALRESEQRYRMFFEHNPQPMWVYDLETLAFLDVNDAAVSGYGYSREEFLGLKITDIRPPEDVPTLMANLADGHPQLERSDGWRHRRRDGRIIRVEISSHALSFQGRTCRMVQATDVTSRLAAEDALRASEERFRSFMTHSPAAGWIVDEEGTLEYLSPGYYRLFGGARDQAGLRVGEVADPALAEIYLENNRTVFREQRVVEAVEPGIRSDGSRGEFLVVKFPIQVPGNRRLVGGIALDITERKKLEHEFLRAQRMESIGTLAGGIAHDLNNVLSPIVLSIDLLQMRIADEEGRELLQVLSASAQRAADLIKQVLSFARGVEGRRVALRMNDLVRDIEKIVNDTFLKHIRVQTRVSPDLWAVLGDPTQMHQLLLNLCVNARDAMPDGGTLLLKAENFVLGPTTVGGDDGPKAGPYVLVQVEDSGCGIAPEIREKIFDPFFTTKEVGKGTGLGLSTSAAIVKSHGGFVRVYSEVGRGSQFQIFLPAVPQIPRREGPEIMPALPPGRGELILLVDDEASVRLLTQRTLEAAGYRVVTAGDGLEALRVYHRRGAEISAVLTDMMMPGMDGPATIQGLRKLAPDLPIIAASGLLANGQVAQAANLGVQHFLAKPYAPEALLNILHSLLASGR